MAELPEIIIITNQMNEKIKGKFFKEIEIFQKKCLNCSLNRFISTVKSKRIEEISYSGKWFIIHMENGYILINLGMGGDMIYFTPKDCLPSKYQFKFLFEDGTGFTIRFWWFGYVHYVKSLKDHNMTKDLGPSALHFSFSLDKFLQIMEKKKGFVKSFLLNQKNISGIGNFYIHDILFKAKIHPLKRVEDLSKEEKNTLYKAIRERLSLSLELGGADYELNFLGERGNFTADMYLIAYKEGKYCPECGTKIEKIKTGSNYSFICRNCQRL